MPIKLNAATGGGSVALSAPNSTTSNADVTLTLPPNDGDASQYLQTDGAGALSWQTVAPAAFESYACIVDQKTAGTSGGASSTGSWNARDLNTERTDPDNIVSISSNLFTPVAGTYLIRWTSPFIQSYSARTRLRNDTQSSTIAMSSGIYTHASYPVVTFTPGFARITANGTDAYAIQYRVETGHANGLGVGWSGVGSDYEQYTIVELFKEA